MLGRSYQFGHSRVIEPTVYVRFLETVLPCGVEIVGRREQLVIVTGCLSKVGTDYVSSIGTSSSFT